MRHFLARVCFLVSRSSSSGSGSVLISGGSARSRAGWRLLRVNAEIERDGGADGDANNDQRCGSMSKMGAHWAGEIYACQTAMSTHGAGGVQISKRLGEVRLECDGTLEVRGGFRHAAQGRERDTQIVLGFV